MIAQTVSPVLPYATNEALQRHIRLTAVEHLLSILHYNLPVEWSEVAGLLDMLDSAQRQLPPASDERTASFLPELIGKVRTAATWNTQITELMRKTIIATLDDLDNDPYATLPPVGGGSQDNDETPDMESIKALVNAAWNALYITSNADTPEAHAFAYQQIDNAFAALSRLRDMVGKEDDPYANLPPMGGGAHTAAEEAEYIVSLSKENECSLVTGYGGGVIHWKQLADAIQSARNILNAGDNTWTGYAVMEMPANVTVARWAADDPYANLPAIGGGSHTAAELTPTRATSQKRDNQRAERNAQQEAYHAHATAQVGEIADILGDMGFENIHKHNSLQVWMWESEHATIKQTPYTVRIYNGRRVRYGKHADAKLTNRMEHGWCQDGEATGYAAGIVAALLPLLETPDPYMQALDAMERKATMNTYDVMRAAAGFKTEQTVTAANEHDAALTMARGPLSLMGFTGKRWVYEDEQSDALISVEIRTDEQEISHDEPANAYTLATPSPEGGLQTILAVSRYDADPAISGGSQVLTEDDYCLIDGPARYSLEDASPLAAGNALIAEANRCIQNAYDCVVRQNMSTESRNRIVNDANATLSAARHLTLVCTDHRASIDAEEMDRLMEELRILHHVCLVPPAGLLPRMNDLGILKAWYAFRHMLGHDRTTCTVTFNNDARETFTAHGIVIARKMAQNATACGLTDCATIHETPKHKPAVFRERWQDGTRIATYA